MDRNDHDDRRNGVMCQRISRLPILLFVFALMAAACGSSSNDGGGAASSTSAATPSASPSAPASATGSGGGQITIGGDAANDHGSKDVTGQSSVDLEMEDFYFKPTVITGTPGQSLTVDMENGGSALHNFSLTDQGIDQDVQAGRSESVTVTIPQSGFVEFFCKYHKSLGMVGELTTS